MFFLNRDTELDTQLLNKMVQRFSTAVVPKLEKYKKYYDGAQAIMQKAYPDPTKPCSRTVTNYCKDIVDGYCGYLAAPGYINYRSNEEDIEQVMDVLKYNDYQFEDSDFLLDALIYGVAAELMYIDSQGKTRFKLIDPRTCFGIYDDSLSGDLMYFVRIYEASEWDNTDLHYIDVYTDYEVRHYKASGKNGNLIPIGSTPHYFSQCPANIFYLPDEKSIFDCIMSLQDGYNELLSGEIDDYAAFCDAYLVISGADADAEDVGAMKENRVLVLPEGASAGWLTKNANDAQVENILKRIHDSIYRIAHCPDFSSESFVGGVSSGIAIKYRLTGMETRGAKVCAVMEKALRRRIEIIAGIASIKLGEEVFKDVEIDFKRNIAEDNASTINMINTLHGMVSDRTLLSQLPFVDDVDAELEAIQEQKLANMSIYNFENLGETEEEEQPKNQSDVEGE